MTAPYCDASGVCVPCNEAPLPADADAACAAADSDTPVCFDGACVQCNPLSPAACVNPTPVCDPTSNECVVCTAHDLCGPAACNLFTGACLPADAVVHVGGDPMVDLPNFDTIGEAVASFAGDGAEGTIIVHAGDYNNQPVTVDTNRVIAFLAADAAAMPPRWTQGAGGSPQLEVTTGSTVLLDGLQLSGNADDLGLRVSEGRAWLDRSRIVQNAGGGILAQTNAELTLRNCFVGGSVNNVPALAVEGATARVRYTTIIGGLGSTAEALSCTASTTVTVEDSIILLQSDNPPVTCDDATFDHSVSEVVLPGLPDAMNVNAGNFNDLSDWFVNVATGDFHLSPAGADVFDGIAQWTTGDPPTDIDGDSRPSVDRTADYAGADVPQ